MAAIKINRVKMQLDDPQTDDRKREKMEAYLNKLEEEQREAQAKVADLLGKTNVCKDAVVEIKGEIVPGTLIEICQVALFVTEPLKKVRIRLDKETERLITEKL